MKRILILLSIAATLLTGCAGVQYGGDRTDLWGTPVTAAAATKTIVITPETKFVNLIGGDIVRFVVGDQSFTWSFDGAYFPAAVDISKISNGLLHRPVIAYVEENPMYRRDPS
jgi:ABC-type Fe3+-hydroxamate transport system substrate-binding protein